MLVHSTHTPLIRVFFLGQLKVKKKSEDMKIISGKAKLFFSWRASQVTRRLHLKRIAGARRVWRNSRQRRPADVFNNSERDIISLVNTFPCKPRIWNFDQPNGSCTFFFSTKCKWTWLVGRCEMIERKCVVHKSHAQVKIPKKKLMKVVCGFRENHWETSETIADSQIVY